MHQSDDERQNPAVLDFEIWTFLGVWRRHPGPRVPVPALQHLQQGRYSKQAALTTSLQKSRWCEWRCKEWRAFSYGNWSTNSLKNYTRTTAGFRTTLTTFTTLKRPFWSASIQKKQLSRGKPKTTKIKKISRNIAGTCSAWSLGTLKSTLRWWSS